MLIQVDIRKTFLYKWGKEEGLEEGLKEGLKEGILGIIQAKFGSQKAKQFKNLLDKIDDIDHLKRIKKEVIRTKSWEDFLKFVRNLKNSKKIQN
jgi:flagellar biosynthesis/type III secretory pathway protein FliH